MFKSLVVLVFVCVSTLAYGSEKSLFKCALAGSPYDLVAAVDEQGRIVPMNNTYYIWSNKDKSSPFYVFSFNYKNYPFESIKTFKAPNGFSVVQMVTTADAVLFGISADRTVGFYQYQDLGSGNGNSKLTLKCSPLRPRR